MPCEHLSVQSLIASAAGDRIAGTVEAEPVPVRVLDPSRTLVEKLVLLHTVHSDMFRAMIGLRPPPSPPPVVASPAI